MNHVHLLVTDEGPVRRVTINRPELHNAFNRALIDELHREFTSIAGLPIGLVRAVVLAGAGKSFCAGADVKWMRASLAYTREENVADARAMARMFDAINRCPVPVIGRVHGAALGGGVGLAAVCDIVVASEECKFAFSEAKLGIAPAVISPYVVAKIGESHARALFLTAERFGALRARDIGLVHLVTSSDALDSEVDRLLSEILSSAPSAVARAKQLISELPALGRGETMNHTTEVIASLRVAEEGQAGLRAFLEKERPPWIEPR